MDIRFLTNDGLKLIESLILQPEQEDRIAEMEFHDAGIIFRNGRYFNYSGMLDGAITFCETTVLVMTLEEFPPNG